MNDFKDAVDQLNISKELFILGRGCNKPTKSSGGRKARYSLSSSSYDPQKIYAVQYCKDIDQYIVWKARNRNKYSVIASNVPKVHGNKIDSTRKGVEFEWNDIEDVYTFGKEGINSFLNEYIIDMEKNNCNT